MSVVTESEILRAVLIDPYDLAPRWIYADWLDEHGQPERAEFIRIDLLIHSQPIGDGHKALYKQREEIIKRMDERGIVWGWHPGNDNPYIETVVRRGMVEDFWVPCHEFKRFAKDIFSRHPICRVRLVDRTPCPTLIIEQAYFWGTWCDAGSDRIDEPHLLTPELLYAFHVQFENCEAPFSSGFSNPFGFNESFATPELAHEWLSRACVKVGREMAGLPAI